MDEYEIIIVNDGSPDKSREIVVALAKEIPNIRLIDQDNGGVSAARNKGLLYATGEYVVFIDPDDYVQENMLSTLYDRAKKDDLEILLTGRSSIDTEGNVTEALGYFNLDRQVFSGIEAFKVKDSEIRTYNSSVGYLYKREFLNNFNVYYPLGVMHIEDGVFLRKAFALAKRVGFENTNFYQIYLRIGSATRSKTIYSDKIFRGYLMAAEDLKVFRSEHSLPKEQLKLINGMITKFSLLPIMKAVILNSPKMFIRNLRLLEEHGCLKMDLADLPDTRIKKFAKFFNISPIIFGVYYLFIMTRKRIGLS